MEWKVCSLEGALYLIDASLRTIAIAKREPRTISPEFMTASSNFHSHCDACGAKNENEMISYFGSNTQQHRLQFNFINREKHNRFTLAFDKVRPRRETNRSIFLFDFSAPSRHFIPFAVHWIGHICFATPRLTKRRIRCIIFQKDANESDRAGAHGREIRGKNGGKILENYAKRIACIV